jgi:hypothetical protein
MEKVAKAKQSKVTALDTKIYAILLTNIEAEKSLSRILKINDLSSRDKVNDATEKDFAGLNKDQLQAFAHARRFETPTIPRGCGFKWGKKGTPGSGEDTLLAQAHELRLAPIKLKASGGGVSLQQTRRCTSPPR